MDVFRLLLCIALPLLLWKAEIRGIRPVRDFFLWGVDYPFQFLITATFILVIWGGLGGAFGLQGLFLDEDPLTQVLLGATVMLLFSAIVVHYVALGTSRRGWWTSLRGLTGLLRALNTFAHPARPVQESLANGFLERLSTADMDVIDEVARREEADLAGAAGRGARDRELCEALESEPFRLSVAPAILLAKGFGLVFLLGVVPAMVIPLMVRDPQACLERLPWLVGVCLGYVIGIVLSCWTTEWLAKPAGWRRQQDAILAALARHAAQGEATAAASAVPSVTPIWVAFLAWFFLIHAAVNLLLPMDVTARWIDWPEQSLPAFHGDWQDLVGIWTNFPWLPLAVFVGEAVVAGFLTIGGRRAAAMQPNRDTFSRWAKLLTPPLELVLATLRSRWLHRAVAGAMGILAVASVAATILTAPEATQSLWVGMRGYASLGSVLVGWLGIFWLATHAAAGGGARTPLEQRAAIVGLACLAGLHVLGVPAVVIAPLAATGAVLSGAHSLASLAWERPPRWLRPAWATALGLAAAVSLGVAWRAGTIGVAAGVWLGLAVVFLGSTSLARIAIQRPALLYPLTVLLGYVAFAIPYATLGERFGAALPAAGSIACGVAILAAISTIFTSLRLRSSLLTIAATIAIAILLNGVALFVAPNEFKGTFPAMEPYYKLPIYLDSRDYFRDTTPSTARLRNRAVTEDFDRLARQGVSERLATVYFTVRPLAAQPDGSHAVVVDVEDPRNRLRAAAGDTVGLAAEEWFTIQTDGEDCLALAEEPFFRRIFTLFHYENLHLVRHGIIRGGGRRLIGADAPEIPSRPRSNPLPATAQAPERRDATQPIRYELIKAAAGQELPPDSVLLGLRLSGFAGDYQAAGAEYALIAMNWQGRVTSVRHEQSGDRYQVEFTIPAGIPPPDEEQLRTMQSWMERCHLDTLRPAVRASLAADDVRKRFGLAPPPAGREGDCLVLEDARSDAAVPVGVFLAAPPNPSSPSAAFDAYRPTPAALSATIAVTSASAPVSAEAKPPANPADAFTLRPAHDRGLVASSDEDLRRLAAGGDTESVEVAVYNSARLRVGDRLMLTWNGRHGSASGPDLEHGAVCEVRGIRSPAAGPATASRLADEGLPPGAAWVTLVRVGGSPAMPPTEPRPAPANAPPVVGQWQNLQLLNNAEVLLAWKNLVAPGWTEGKPKLVMVTVSGGGIRASVWASVVLRKLEATLGADFPYHIRLITGASGGMVAGSYYTTSLIPPPPGVFHGGTASFADLHGVSIGEFVDRMALDQLDAVTGQMLFADLPGTVNPFLRQRDRGRTLEETWIRWTGGQESPLGRPLQAYAADERMGWRPSLVFTPMMVEDGRRLLISNLDLAFATRNVGGLLLEPSSRKIERPAFQGGDFDLSIHEEDEVFSLSAVEFFRLFPRAGDFRVTTAIRMSASFPWVSPAINLPTLPPRRVVDAAYYDNYGINLSALWLSKMSQWLHENTSGVLVVQIRDKVSQGARTEIDFDRVGETGSLLDRLVWHGGSKLFEPGLQAITTPLAGLSNAQQWTMAFRNDEQVDLQDLLFDELSGQDFFRTVVFECPVDVSLNWRLTARERAILVGGFGSPDANPADELARVTDYLTGRDSYEFHKWRLENRDQPDFRRNLKARYDEQLRALGIEGTQRLTVEQSQSLYENVVKNLKRLELLADWWNEGKAGVP